MAFIVIYKYVESDSVVLLITSSPKNVTRSVYLSSRDGQVVAGVRPVWRRPRPYNKPRELIITRHVYESLLINRSRDVSSVQFMSIDLLSTI